MNFNAKHGCQRCTVIGKQSGISMTVVFNQLDAALRTDAGFRANEYPQHCKTFTPLVELPIDMIRDFVVADPLHLTELGIMKRLLIGWKTGNMACFKWSDSEVNAMSEFLLSIKTPCEINRDARSLLLLRLWKGQEFKNFLTYFSIVALNKAKMPEPYYKHFMKFFCAVRLASSSKYAPINCALIGALLKDFVDDFRRNKVYGPQFMTSNVHNLLHVVEDVERLGILPSISAYPFESCLGKLKAIIRAGQPALQQIAKRLIERSNISGNCEANATPTQAKIERNGQKCSVHIPGRSFVLCKHRFQDAWFLANGEIMKMVDAETIDGEILIEGVELLSKTDYFDYPIESSLINIYMANTATTSEETAKVKICDITCKFVVINSIEEQYVFLPVLHTEQ